MGRLLLIVNFGFLRLFVFRLTHTGTDRRTDGQARRVTGRTGRLHTNITTINKYPNIQMKLKGFSKVLKQSHIFRLIGPILAFISSQYGILFSTDILFICDIRRFSERSTAVRAPPNARELEHSAN